jgi:hypothetical protein
MLRRHAFLRSSGQGGSNHCKASMQSTGDSTTQHMKNSYFSGMTNRQTFELPNGVEAYTCRTVHIAVGKPVHPFLSGVPHPGVRIPLWQLQHHRDWACPCSPMTPPHATQSRYLGGDWHK